MEEVTVVASRIERPGNTLPMNLIERVKVMTGGASALYGLMVFPASSTS
jgi:outer membrane receptor protein involved in Fe transport